MKKEITISAAYDKRDPDPKKNYGMHGCTLSFVLTGELGAVQFVLYTNWQLPHVTEERWSKYEDDFTRRLLTEPMPVDLGYHSPKPMYAGQTVVTKSCPYLNDKPCYYDGSGLNAEPVYKLMLEGGSDAVWKELEEYYTHTFGELI
jgi:hypothetical protein